MAFQQAAGVEIAPLQEELMLFHPQTNTFCVLNRTTSFLWSQLIHPSTVEQLAQEVCRHFDGVTLADALRDVQRVLAEMVSLNLVVEMSTA